MPSQGQAPAPAQWQGAPTTQQAPPGRQTDDRRYGHPAPTRSNSRVVAITVIVVLVIGGALTAWLLSAPSYDRTTAKGTAAAFAEAVNSRNIDAAQDLMCSRDRRDFGSSEFTSVGGITLTLNGVDAGEDKGIAHYALSASVSGMSAGQHDLDLRLSRTGDDGQWEICGITGDRAGN
jgi:hypothetical protein